MQNQRNRARKDKVVCKFLNRLAMNINGLAVSSCEGRHVLIKLFFFSLIFYSKTSTLCFYRHYKIIYVTRSVSFYKGKAFSIKTFVEKSIF